MFHKMLQLASDFTDETMKNQGLQLPSKNKQGYWHPERSTQATIVLFTEETYITFNC